MPTITIDECERIAAAHHAAEAAEHAPKLGRGTATLTPLGEAVVLARRLGRAIAKLETAEERDAVLAVASSSVLAVIRADAPSAA